METQVNKPYVKRYDEQGLLINPLKENYLHKYPNSNKRKSALRKERFFGNGKNIPLTVYPKGKFLRFRQEIVCVNPKTKKPTGEVRFIEHYIQK